MSDLISRDALIRDISEKIDICTAERKAAIKRGGYNDVSYYSGGISIARRIRRYANMFAPAVDAVPVVRCKDCKHRGKLYECPMRHIESSEGGGPRVVDTTKDEGYCDRGVIRDVAEGK